MFVLVVEDDEDFIDALTSTFAGLSDKPIVSIARSRESALRQLEESFFDLIILDVRIPTTDGGLDADVEHGHMVFTKSQQIAPGTPIFVLTGSPAQDFIPALLGRAQQVDIWGEGKRVLTVDFLEKLRFASFPSKFTAMAHAISTLADIEVDRGAGTALTQAEDRLIRIFTRRRGGARCSTATLGGGLSSAKVLRLRLTDASGAPRDCAVVKIGTHTEALKEANAFDIHVSRLEPHATPRKLCTLDYGAKDRAGVFFSLAEGFEESLFDLVKRHDLRSETAVNAIEELTSKWREGVSETQMFVREVRLRLLDDATFDRLVLEYGLGWARDIETRSVQVRWCCIHGDLHGFNVLVDRDGRSILIDYGDVREGAATLDPVTLELSAIFHPGGPFARSEWPKPHQAECWGDLDEYLVSCPRPEFVRACRKWAMGSAATGRRDLAVAAYGYLVRQLKYRDSDKRKALSILAGVKRLFDST